MTRWVCVMIAGGRFAGRCCATRLLGCPFNRGWCLVCELRRLAVVCVDCRCSLYPLCSLAVPGVSGRLRVTPGKPLPSTPAQHQLKQKQIRAANCHCRIRHNEKSSRRQPQEAVRTHEEVTAPNQTDHDKATQKSQQANIQHPCVSGHIGNLSVDLC